MPTIGPTLPPHLAQTDEHSADETEFPAPPAKRRRSSSSTSPPSPKRRTIGPAAPPATLAETPSKTSTLSHEPTGVRDPASSDSGSDDDFGPALPPPPNASGVSTIASTSRFDALQDSPQPAQKTQREEWMLAPPTASSLASTSRIDPTKLRNRKFATGRAANAPSSSSGAHASGGLAQTWTETPEEKQRRLADEVLGVSAPANSDAASGNTGPGDGKRYEEARTARKAEEAREAERRIREFNEREGRRGAGSLVDQHAKAKGGKREEEDDPSRRAFDREKDMRVGGTVGAKGQREMLRRAKDMGGRFSGGSYL